MRRDQGNNDHHTLRHDDLGRNELRWIYLFRGGYRKPVERQQSAIAQVKTGECRGQDQQRLVPEQGPETGDLTFLVLLLGLAQSARLVIVDRVGRDHEHGNDGQDAEAGGEPEHGGQSEMPSEKSGQRSADQITGMIGDLVMSVLPIEAGLMHDAERDAGDCRHDRRA